MAIMIAENGGGRLPDSESQRGRLKIFVQVTAAGTSDIHQFIDLYYGNARYYDASVVSSPGDRPRFVLKPIRVEDVPIEIRRAL